MNLAEDTGINNHREPVNIEDAHGPQTPELTQQQPLTTEAGSGEAGTSAGATPVTNFATRAGIKGTDGIGKNKLFLLGGGLLAAVLFFALTAIIGKSPAKNGAAKKLSPQQETSQHKGSVTPLMETVRTPDSENANGQLGPGDIKRTRSTDGAAAIWKTGKPPAGSKSATGDTLGSVPSFSDTQQKWEEPRPYGESAPASAAQTQQQQNALKEPSLIFVRSAVQNQTTGTARDALGGDDAPLLDMAPGTRIQAKLETQISSAVEAPVVAVVEYTYAIGDRIVVPAGARVYGQFQQADRNGYVNVKFDEIELLDGVREKIEAVATDLDLGPIKGTVYGKNTGRNFLVRTAAGIGSVAAMLVGNNTSSSFSEDDLIRERVAQNVGNAGDSNIMNMAINSRLVVSVPADTKIYVVFTKHEQSSPTLRRVSSTNP
jgi:hypothetical protein